MANIIKHFQTISRHEQQLRQSPATIRCLVSVLNYIKSVLNDDSTQELLNTISQHVNLEGKDAHYLNLELMSEQIIDALRRAFVSLGLYTNDNVANQLYIDFFKDIYDGGYRYDGVNFAQVPSVYDSDTIIPLDYDGFVKWLVSNPEIYSVAIPDDYDELKTGLTLRLAKEWFDKYHDNVVDAHSNSVSEKLDDLMTVCSVLPAYWITPVNFETSVYKIIGSVAYAQLMALVIARLVAMGSPLTIDFTSNEDTMETLLLVGYDEARLIGETFFNEFYSEVKDSAGVIIVQFDLNSLKALYEGGAASYDGYLELLSDCGESDSKLYKKKWSDYYTNHLNLIVSDSMTQAYKDDLIALRNNVNINYTKMYHIHTTLKRNNFGINVTFSLSHLVPSRTVDIINIVGLSKSVVSMSIIPYEDVYNNKFNKLVVAFDNYNPDFTVTILDEITENSINHLNVVITLSRDFLIVHTKIGDNYSKKSFANINRMFDVDPFFLYTMPRVAEYVRGTNRITNIRLFGKYLNDDDALAVIAGFRQL